MTANPWYILRVAPSLQKAPCEGTICSRAKITHYLVEKGFEPYNPIECRIRVHRKSDKLLSYSEPMYAGYCFVRHVDGRFAELERVKGVHGILRVAGEAMPLPSADYRSIKNSEAAEYDYFLRKWGEATMAPDMKTRKNIAKQWENGQSVVIGGKGSLLQDVQGKITNIRSADLAKVFIAAFNREVDVPIANLKKVV